MSLAELTDPIFYGVAILNWVAWAFLVIVLLAKFTKPTFWPKLHKNLQKNATLYAFLMALFATLCSLWLSGVAGFLPCRYCWWQRIFMFPNVIVLGYAVWKGFKVKLIAITLAVIGLLIALWHYLVQRIEVLGHNLPCSADGLTCSTQYLGYWGFYSIPLMALTAFAMIILFLSFSKQ